MYIYIYIYSSLFTLTLYYCVYVHTTPHNNTDYCIFTNYQFTNTRMQSLYFFFASYFTAQPFNFKVKGTVSRAKVGTVPVLIYIYQSIALFNGILKIFTFLKGHFSIYKKQFSIHIVQQYHSAWPVLQMAQINVHVE